MGRDNRLQLINLNRDTQDISPNCHLFPTEAFYNRHLEGISIFVHIFLKAHHTITSGHQLHILFPFLYLLRILFQRSVLLATYCLNLKRKRIDYCGSVKPVSDRKQENI